ncbi:MAG: 50S ribosomal protein L18 [Candidatus Buchananbacteria bacterium]
MLRSQKIKQDRQQRRKNRVRAKISGDALRPRMNVYRSLKHFYVQLIDDQQGKTLASAKDTEIKDQGNKTVLAGLVGELIAAKALKLGIKEAVFDKSSYKFHGRVKAAAEGARKGGLKF